jgi:1-deoxy-D-xylulose-5-phosphate reductoisomerase
MKRIALFGSTGCVGRKTLEVIDCFKDAFKVVALSCYSNTSLLEEQKKKYSPKFIFIGSKKNPLSLEEIASHPDVDICVFAMEGSEGILAAFAAASACKEIALANKEILACAGEAFMSLCREKGVKIAPLDSEHSAIEQCLLGEKGEDVHKYILTASGGPFFSTPPTYEKAFTHPTYRCGKKVAVNCSTLMNKGLEVIEAKHLFNIDNDQIDVVIHPQSLVHSFVSFKDGAVKAFFGKPDILQAIQYALLGGERRKGVMAPFAFDRFMQCTFYPYDKKKFRCLQLSFDALKEGGAYPAYLNAANEVLVDRFCKGGVSWEAIGESLEELMNKGSISKDSSLESVLETDKQARREAAAFSAR